MSIWNERIEKAKTLMHRCKRQMDEVAEVFDSLALTPVEQGVVARLEEAVAEANGRWADERALRLRVEAECDRAIKECGKTLELGNEALAQQLKRNILRGVRGEVESGEDAEDGKGLHDEEGEGHEGKW